MTGPIEEVLGRDVVGQAVREPGVGGLGVLGDRTPAMHAPELLEDFLGSLAAFGHALEKEFDPRRFLSDFSGRIQPFLPHDRLVLISFSDDLKTFSVFAEHVGKLGSLHEKHYTTLFRPSARYLTEAWPHAEVAEGETVCVEDLLADPRYVGTTSVQGALREMGIRSTLKVPLFSSGRVVGALIASSLVPGNFRAQDVRIARDLAALVGPFAHNMVLLQRERERRRRHSALERLAQELSSSLDLREVFDKLARAVKPILDYDIIGIVRFVGAERDLEGLAEIDAAGPGQGLPDVSADAFSFTPMILSGRTIVIADTQRELRPEMEGDRHVLGLGVRSTIIAPLVLGDAVGGALYFGKRVPHWYDAADAEVAAGMAPQVALAVQHQRLAEEQHKAAQIELRAERLAKRVESLEVELDARFGFGRIVGRASALRDALTGAAKVAPTETTVLITGESGTGKELVAHAIHAASPRADGPFLGINCAALPEALLESELFGHEKGAFTGADRAKPGRFELAAGGTLLLDEVGELTPSMQAKLLRVLQEREFTRVGGTATRKADVRVIAATNRDLRSEVEARHFRSDLYYRLGVFVVHLPPLRERGEDVLLLAEHFVREFEARMGKSVPGLSREARSALLAYPWPGNIRELSNAVERALIMNDGGLIAAVHLGLDPSLSRPLPCDDLEVDARPAGTEREPLGSLAESERRMIIDALSRAAGNKSRAAELLGLSRSQLYTRLKRFGLEA